MKVFTVNVLSTFFFHFFTTCVECQGVIGQIDTFEVRKICLYGETEYIFTALDGEIIN